jgi:gamma-glutamyl hercynylcysteine S-oxide synthase
MDKLSGAAARSDGSIRSAGPSGLALALTAERRALLQLFEAYRDALGPDLRVPYSPELNLPLWELGHIGWFEAHWIARNPQRAAGSAADPSAVPADPDDLAYDSSRIAHADRWRLPLPAAQHVLDELSAGRERTLALLAELASAAGSETPEDRQLYFFRLAHLHEAMHREAWAYMAQTLDIAVPLELPKASPHPGETAVAGGAWSLGANSAGFAFDNELAAHAVELPAFAIDRAPVSWGRYLPFVESGGYDQAAFWSPEGWQWRQRQRDGHPRHLRPAGHGHPWASRQFGRWVEVDAEQPAVHLTLYEAQAWCRWAGRRLPSEAEWEMAACTADQDFVWGDVWEWTADRFLPYPGFAAHPYRDYSVPSFGSHQVLRGASFATSQSIRHPRYRNFYRPDRNDIFAGFRSCTAA